MTADNVKARLIRACEAIVAAQDDLTAADQAIGDGDHGLGMARGFKAARIALETKPAATPGELFKLVGMAILSTAGGASGAVFGTLFLGAAKALDGATLDAASYAKALQAGASAVMARGGAKAGDKTMLDALVPAAVAASTATNFESALAAAAEAARSGAAATANMIATTGKAKTLGQRSLGHRDPGAISMSIILAALAE